MAKMIDNEPIYSGEKKVWKMFSNNLPQHFVVYNTRSIKGWEFDFCIMAEGMGLFVIEVKGWKAETVFNVINEDTIILAGEEKPCSSPRKQARGYRFSMVNMFRQTLGINPLVMDLVCYPFISKKEYYEKRLDIISDETETIFSEDLENVSLLTQKLTARYNINKGTPHDELNAKRFVLIRHYFEPNFDLKRNTVELNPGYSRLRIIRQEIRDEVVDEIIQEYFSGIKEIIFVSSGSSLIKLVDQVEAQLAARKLYPEKGDLGVGEQKGIRGNISQEYNIFNFAVFELPELVGMTEEDVLIEEGKYDERQKILLKELAAKTAFNFQQYEIEHAPGYGNILVSAGAGTGKTYSMVSRIAFLCNRSADAIVNIVSDIAMITFTNDAAKNMKNRLKKMFMNYFVLTSNQKYMHLIEDMGQVQISTIHKFAIFFLKNECMCLGLGYDCQVTNETYDRKKLYHLYLNAYFAEKMKEDPSFVHQMTAPSYILEELLINFCDQLYNKSIDVKRLSMDELDHPIETMPYFNELVEKVVIKAEVEYANLIKERNMLSLRDCMIQLHGMVKDGKITEHRNKYKYVFVDEFQDTDDGQIETVLGLQKLFGEQCRLFVVGDLKQSIYRFRGATLSAFDQVRDNGGDWLCFTLNRNYRTDSRLLDQLHCVFFEMGRQMRLPYEDKDHLTSRIVKKCEDAFLLCKISTHSKDSGCFYDDLFNELKVQTNAIIKLGKQYKLGAEEKTIAILVRYNWQIFQIVKEAEKRGIVVRTADGGDLYRLPSTMDLYKLVMAVTHPHNKVYLANLIMSNYVSLNLNMSLLKTGDSDVKTEELIRVLDEYFMLILGKRWNQLIAEFESKPVLVVLREIYEATKPWRSVSGDQDMQSAYRMNYECLIEKILQKYAREYMTINMVNDFLKINITTYQEEASRKPEYDSKDVDVICTTIHKAKGLEYGTVMLPYTGEDISDIRVKGLSVNVLGGKIYYSFSQGKKVDYSEGYDIKAEMYEKECEETRILYVALTRAIRNIVWFEDLDSEVQTSWGNFLEVVG